MASSATHDQRRKEDLELLALFDEDCPQDLAIYSHVNLPLQLSASSNEFPGLQEDNVNVANWTANFDEETLAYLDEIIAADQASSRPLCPKPASSGNDATFSIPRRFKCPMCPKEFNSNAAKRYHGRRHILKMIRCPCGFKGQSFVQKQKHYIYHHVGVSKHNFLASF